jgi:hypothetical protein
MSLKRLYRNQHAGNQHANHLILRQPEGPRWLLTWALDLWPGDRAPAGAAEPCALGGRSVKAPAARDALCWAL